MFKKRISALVVAFSLVATGVAAAAPATAVDYLQSGIAIRDNYSGTATRLGLGYPGQGATRITLPVTLYGTSYSYSNSRYGTGTSLIWVKNTNNTTGVTGFSGYYFIG